MSDPTTDQPKTKIKATHIIIAALVLVSIFQTLALIQQGRRQSMLEKQRVASLPVASAITQRTSIPHAVTGMTRHPAATHQNPLTRMAQSPWDNDPFEEFDSMSRRMSNMMRQAFAMAGPLMQSMPAASSSADFVPAADIEETDKAYIVRSDLPGLEKDKISVTVENNVLTVQGMRQTNSESNDKNRGFYSQERSYGSFSRSFNLPGPVDDSKINADYKNGVLTITLPKASPAKSSQKVAIQ